MKKGYYTQLKRYCQGTCNGSSVPCSNFLFGETTTPDDDAETSTPTTSYPWTNGNTEISAYCYWVSNFQSDNQVTYLKYISQNQTTSSESYAIDTTQTYTYSNNIPEGMNCVILFTGYSNCNDAINNSGTLYNNAVSYFNGNENPYLISLSFGGGNDNGEWDTGSSGAIYSIYEAVTKNGKSFTYTETGTGNTLTGTGSGKLTNQYNSLFFDIETGTSSGQDFINLFNYIKNNKNSEFYGYECIIIVSVAHSCSNYSSTTVSDISTIYMSNSYDYLQNQLYTQNIGTTNEYCANYNILWNENYGTNGFVNYIAENPNYQTYGLNMLLPGINFSNLYNGPGTNINGSSSYPNLYYYQSSSNTETFVESSSGWITINYPTDEGALNFYNAIFGTNSPTLGGYMQWVNGTVSS